MIASHRALLRLALLALPLIGVLFLAAPRDRRLVVSPGRIIGGSMAPTLRGKWHFAVVCADCGFPFACDANDPPSRDLAVCPNCGYAENEVRDNERHDGEQVGIRRSAFAGRPPRRWEVVAVQSPEVQQEFSVKRIVGLPGEHIAILEGDLYADGKLLRKSLIQLKQLAVTVHDDRYRPAKSKTLPPRWQGIGANTHWRAEPDGYACDAIGARGELDWLAYHNWPCVLNPLERTRESPVLDNDSYNQNASRNLQDVRDLLVACRIEAEGPGELVLRLHNGREWFEVGLLSERGEAIVRRQGNELARCRVAPGVLRRGAQVEFALCDRQALLAVAGEQLFQLPYDASAEPTQPLSNPVGIGAKDLTVRVWDLRILRDIHYLDPLSLGTPWSADQPLAADEFFVLGDNVTLSDDSRNWKPRSVTRRSLLGSVRK